MLRPSSDVLTIEEVGVTETAGGARPREQEGLRPEARPILSAKSALVLAILLGLCAGYLDLAFIVFKKAFVNPEGYYRLARDFPWSVPLGHAALLMAVPGLLLAMLARLRPGLVSLRLGTWLLATLAIWGALLRLPMYGWCSLLLAGGLARPVAVAVAARRKGDRRWRYAPAAILGVLGLLAAASSGRQALAEYRAIRSLPEAPPRARNVLLIVWDTVRAHSLGHYGYKRDTTPNLEKWAAQGVTYHYALAPAPWTVPSHSCFFTGHWPMEIDSQWSPRLDTPHPTLAEYLASRGYQTAGFAANTNCVTYEGGLNRGFAHFEDYAMNPASLLARTVPGQWLLTQSLHLIGDHYDEHWIGLQSRGAPGINDAFLDWLGRRRADRPFFAFLNYFDAHDVYMPPPDYLGRSGIRPTTRREYQFLEDFEGLNKGDVAVRDIIMARDCYDDCVSYMDHHLGRLLEDLKDRGVLADTDVIITSDHGESFGEHGYVNHSYSAHIEELRVPLVILSPGAPAGSRVFHPVSLRDLPATVLDRLGLTDDSPFPGRSLAAFWGLRPGQFPSPPNTPAFSQQDNRAARTLLRPLPGPGGIQPGFQMSLVAWDHQYIRNGEGKEMLFDLTSDIAERYNIVPAPEARSILEAMRAKLLEIITKNPASPAVERVYMQDFRRTLEAVVRGGSGGDRRGDADGEGPDRRPDS